MRCTVNKTSKHKLHTLGKKKGKEISDIVKNYDYSSFHLSPTREKKSTLLGLICFWRESQRRIGKLKKKERFTGISSLLLHHLKQRQNKWVSKFYHFEVKKIEKTFFIFIPRVNIPLHRFLLRPLFLNFLFLSLSLSLSHVLRRKSLSQTYFIKLTDNHTL